MTLDSEARQIVDLVQELQDERDELLDILRGVLAAQATADSATAVAVIPVGLMNEIQRRVATRGVRRSN